MGVMGACSEEAFMQTDNNRLITYSHMLYPPKGPVIYYRVGATKREGGGGGESELPL